MVEEYTIARGRCSSIAARAAERAARAQASSINGIRPPFPRPLGGSHDDRGPGSLQGPRELLVRLTQPRRAAQRDEQDVRPCHGFARYVPPKPGVRTSWIGLSGDVLST